MLQLQWGFDFVEYDKCLHFYCASKSIDNLVLTSSWTPIQEPSIITFFSICVQLNCQECLGTICLNLDKDLEVQIGFFQELIDSRG